MTVIYTKYSVGDVVWFASTNTERKQHPCPDCNDTKKWNAVSPAGYEYTFGCPRCSARYASHDELSLAYTATVPSTRQLTIGSVRHDSADGWGDGRGPKTTYMCVETGVGGGSVYDENRLFDNEADALICAKLLASEANATVPYIVKQYNRSLEISDYQLESALLKKAAEARSRAGQLLWNLSALFDTIKEADDKDAILEAVEEYREYNWARDKEVAGEPA